MGGGAVSVPAVGDPITVHGVPATVTNVQHRMPPVQLAGMTVAGDLYPWPRVDWESVERRGGRPACWGMLGWREEAA